MRQSADGALDPEVLQRVLPDTRDAVMAAATRNQTLPERAKNIGYGTNVKAFKFTDPIKRIIYASLYTGLTLPLAAKRAGIAPATLNKWLNIGIEEVEASDELGIDPPPGSYGEFVIECDRYIAMQVQEALEAIKSIGDGGHVIRKTTRERQNKDGTVTRTTDEMMSNPQWQAHAFLVERRHQEYSQRPQNSQEAPQVTIKFVNVENWRAPYRDDVKTIEAEVVNADAGA